MWYRGSLGDEEKSFRMIGASCARSACPVSAAWQFHAKKLTLTAESIAIDRGAADHDIVDNGKTALATDPFALAVFDATIGQDRGLVEPNASVVELLGNGNLFRVEEIPY